MHAARLRPGRHELWGGAVWEELERKDIALAVVEFSGRAGRGGETTSIELSHVDGSSQRIGPFDFRDEFAHALEAPVWERYGMFAGMPAIQGRVVWTLGERRIVISGRRGDVRFQEIVS